MHLRHHNVNKVHHTISKNAMSFGLKTTLFTAIKVDKFHYILAEIKMQAMPGRFSEHRLRIALFSQQQINSLLRISSARLRYCS